MLFLSSRFRIYGFAAGGLVVPGEFVAAGLFMSPGFEAGGMTTLFEADAPGIG
jgi:hypothetical protein